ncbi:MAG: transposase [Planctomycetota bacterium]
MSYSSKAPSIAPCTYPFIAKIDPEYSGKTSCWTMDSSKGHTRIRLQLFAMAYNLGNLLRRLAPPTGVKRWSLTALRDNLIIIGTKRVWRAGIVTFQMAEVAMPRDLFRGIIARMRRLAAAAPMPAG